jgi:D-glycero-D-manno-heptose 1,7-bisphosphate phosphatase
MSAALTSPPRPAVFLDRDGTLNEEVHYLHRAEDFRWIPGAPEAVRRLNEAGLLVLVVTNQAGVARGFYTEADVDRLHAHLQAELARHGARVDAFYYSPYHPEGTVERYARASDCRKPGTALFERAVAAWGVDPARSFVVGDRATDLAPGRALGMRTVLVETGYGRAERADADADFVAADVGEAVSLVLDVLSHAQPPS